MSGQYTPMFRQYLEIKAQVPDCILFYRLGDFYEMFFDDARLASKELDVVLTGRECGLTDRAPMCGIPYHACEGYLSTLVDKGYKVAICEQVTPPGKGLVKREIVRIVTKGTIIEPTLLGADTANYLCCVYAQCHIDNKNNPKERSNTQNCKYGVAWADVSTGQFGTQECEQQAAMQDLLARLRPKEIICNDAIFEVSFEFGIVKSGDCPKFSKHHEWSFELDTATSIASRQLDKKIFEKVKKSSLELCAIGALLEYIKHTNKSAMTSIVDIDILDDSQYLALNQYTTRTLELTSNMRDGSKTATLLNTINFAKTDMGKRKLAQWLSQPLLNVDSINARLDAVQALYSNFGTREAISIQLQNMADIERLSMKILHGNARPQDLLKLSQSLSTIPTLLNCLGSLTSPLPLLEAHLQPSQRLGFLQKNISQHNSLCLIIDRAITEQPALRPQDGEVIKHGYDAELDELKRLKTDSTTIIANLERAEREATGIKKLKVCFNRISGYYIEVPRSLSNEVPYRYVRKQTMSTVERYITDELKEIEQKVLNAQERLVRLELALYDKLIQELVPFVQQVLVSATHIAELDCLNAFAIASYKYNYNRPVVSDNVQSFEIVEGRHPIAERLTDNFVPNDTKLDSQHRTMVITGPNMSGKSVYMRQVALIAILAQIGCFVPAKQCEMFPLSGIFARIGAGDDMMSGRSTFMVEMSEVATILQNMTDKSLILLDELGRGTATYDGISIAKAVVEHITHNTKAFTLFSTHYHELTTLDNLPSCHNYQMAVQDMGDKILFLNRLTKGGTSKSFGIQVAALSGLPQVVVERAKQILSELG